MMWSDSYGILQYDGHKQWQFVLPFLCEKYVERLHQKSTSCNQSFIVLIDFGYYKLLYFLYSLFTELWFLGKKFQFEIQMMYNNNNEFQKHKIFILKSEHLGPPSKELDKISVLLYFPLSFYWRYQLLTFFFVGFPPPVMSLWLRTFTMAFFFSFFIA